VIVCVFVAVALISVSIAVLTASTPKGSQMTAAPSETVTASPSIGSGHTSDNRGGSPVLSPAQLEDLAKAAGFAFAQEARAGYITVVVTAETRGATRGIGNSGSPLKWSAGQEFELAALCMGRGSVTVRWQAPGGVTGELPVTCSERGAIARVRFTPPVDGQLVQCTLTPDDEAVGRAGLAIGVVEFQ
jgi:hypothetical protein